MKLKPPCCDLIMFSDISRKQITLNWKRAHETAGILQGKINYIFFSKAVNIELGKSKAKSACAQS